MKSQTLYFQLKWILFDFEKGRRLRFSEIDRLTKLAYYLALFRPLSKETWTRVWFTIIQASRQSSLKSFLWNSSKNDVKSAFSEQDFVLFFTDSQCTSSVAFMREFNFNSVLARNFCLQTRKFSLKIFVERRGRERIHFHWIFCRFAGTSPKEHYLFAPFAWSKQTFLILLLLSSHIPPRSKSSPSSVKQYKLD